MFRGMTGVSSGILPKSHLQFILGQNFMNYNWDLGGIPLDTLGMTCLK
jgi:hypothetical protein